MRIAERQAQERAIYVRVIDELIDAAAERDGGVGRAGEIAAREGVDPRTVYRWVQHLDREIDAERRRRALALAVLLWGGVLLAVATGIAVVFGRAPREVALVGVGGGLGGAVVAALRSRGARGRAQERVRERETSGDGEATPGDGL